MTPLRLLRRHALVRSLGPLRLRRLSRPLLVAGLGGALLLPAAVPVAAQPAPAGASAEIRPRGTGAVGGAATFTAAGTRTVVTVRVTGLPPNATFVNHVNAGRCGGPDRGIALALSDLVSDARGMATARTAVDAPLARLLDGNHYVNVHGAAVLPSPDVACGQIVAGAAPGGPAVRLPATGGGPRR